MQEICKLSWFLSNLGGTMCCIHCGAKLPEGTNFCIKCGAPVEKVESDGSEKKPSVRRW
ncbi:zinc-ribbon domain-containing protein [Lactobacillus delbrueckii]|nr:zinc-ribbon domain-containing protein [Lactobacillus delbrueckii]QDH97997.1 zinc ribbon domain-containing protein [Lactobacillus delbrueckii subsp. bulgaricus]